MSAKVAAASAFGAKPSFVTKHTAACTFSPPIDEASIPYLGFLPQDMNGDEIFNYIHPLDLPVLKEAFEAAMLEQGKPVSSKLIRFRVRNGGYIHLNSWWSSFINPWSRLLEFIHGKHFVLKGPRLPDVFGEPQVRGDGGMLALTEEDEEGAAAATDPQLPKEELAKENLRVQNDIRNILRRTIQRSTTTFLDAQPNSSTKTKKELSNFMGSLLEVAKAETTKLGRYGGQGGGGGKGGPGGHVVVAHISPHQSDSSETPPSYNQLTYNENLTRFFNSQPKTLSEREVQEKYEERSSGDLLDEVEGTTIGASNESSHHHHHHSHHNKEKKKHGGGGGGSSGNKRRAGGGGGGGRGAAEDGAQSSAQGSRTSGDQGHASGKGGGGIS